ncbi:MAG: MBOAT family protein, partial [Bacteroidales bacterium]|nr:MBOAT family protein [Bacteroidales bacterium]
FVIFLVSGLWHGANWTFLAWGAYHALLFLPLILMGRNRRYRNTVAEGKWLPSLKEAGQMILTFVLVVFGWIIFRAESIGDAWQYICRIFSHDLFTMPFLFIGAKKTLLFSAVMLIMEWLSREKEHALCFGSGFPIWVKYSFYYVLILAMLEYSPNSQAFIYFQF